MRFMIMVRATGASEAQARPGAGVEAKVMAEMAAYHEALAKAGVLLDANGLKPSAHGWRVRYSNGKRTVIDGPFAETKEQLLGLYVVNCADEDAAIAIARDLRRVNPSAVYEIRPIRLYLPGESLPETAQEDGQA